MIKVDVKTPRRNPLLRSLVAHIQNRSKFVTRWANAAAMEGRENARAKGGRRWWRDLARSLRVRSVSETCALVDTSQVGATLQQYGGTVRPKRKRFLTIPIAPEARGKRASEFERPDRPLFVLPGTRLLGYNKGRGKSTQFHPLFRLSRQAKVPADPWYPDTLRNYKIGIAEAYRVLNEEGYQWNMRH